MQAPPYWCRCHKTYSASLNISFWQLAARVMDRTETEHNFIGRHIVITLSVRPASCPVHISYILWGRNFKFGVWMHLGMAECRVPFWGHCDLNLWLSLYSNKMSVRPASCPEHISYILWGRHSKFGVWMHLGMAECHVSFLGHCDLDLWPSF